MGTIAAVFVWAAAAAAGVASRADYTGSEGCRGCHEDEYRGWEQSFHARVVQDPRERPDALLGDFSAGEAGFSPSDVEFTVGGHWYQRYAVRLDGETYVLPRVWSVASHRWERQDEFSWKRKPYATFCIGCHATRYDPENRTYVEHRVGCEACHGPGRRHAATTDPSQILNPGRWTPDERDLLCASCHVRGTDPSGRYRYPVGYAPGDDLTRHYTTDVDGGASTPRASFLALFRRWSSRAGRRQPPPDCEVCGIEGRAPSAPSDAETEPCMGCHRFGDDYAAHTRHPGDLALRCGDCHAEVDRAVVEPADVHSQAASRVHRETGYAAAAESDCRGCHRDREPSALRENLRTWGASHRAAD